MQNIGTVKNTLSHKNNRVFILKFKPSLSIDLVNSTDPDTIEYLKNCKSPLGSYFDGSKVATGLEYWEEKVLLPLVIKVEHTERDFRDRVEKFYCDFDIDVPFEGLELQTGLEENNDLPIAYLIDENGKIVKDAENNFVIPHLENDKKNIRYNLPINIKHFLAYRLALRHPKVAFNIQDFKGDASKTFYLENPIKVKDEREKSLGIKDEASVKYLDIKKEPSTVSKVLLLLGKDIKTIPKEERAFVLRTFVDKEPAKFLEVVNDKFLNEKFDIKYYVSLGLLQEVGELPTYVVKESQKVIGKGIQEAILFFQDEGNSEVINRLKALKEDKLTKLK